MGPAAVAADPPGREARHRDRPARKDDDALPGEKISTADWVGTRKSAFKRFGFCPYGTIGVWKSLAATITARGGAIWLSSQVEHLNVTDGLVTGAIVMRDGERVEVGCAVAVSDAGPAVTARARCSH